MGIVLVVDSIVIRSLLMEKSRDKQLLELIYKEDPVYSMYIEKIMNSYPGALTTLINWLSVMGLMDKAVGIVQTCPLKVRKGKRRKDTNR